MDKSVAALLGAVTALAAGSAHAATAAQVSVDGVSVSEVMQVRSYSDLLKPIPNALAVLKAATVPYVPNDDEPATVEKVQYHHHHHHHHHHRRHHHHHHHHHHFLY